MQIMCLGLHCLGDTLNEIILATILDCNKKKTAVTYQLAEMAETAEAINRN